MAGVPPTEQTKITPPGNVAISHHNVEMTMTERRPMGSVEAEILRALWANNDLTTPAEIREALSFDLAYTTVNTILMRLWNKGLVDRERLGRGFSYRAKLGEDELTATRMFSELGRAEDRSAALTRFVGRLGKRDLAALRKIIESPTK